MTQQIPSPEEPEAVELKPPEPFSERSSAADPTSSMAPRFNLFFRGFAKRFFRHLDLDDQTVSVLRDLESRGSVIYVMRYSSRLDYFLFNTLFAREGLRLSAFANGIRYSMYRPFFNQLRIFFGNLRARISGRPRRSNLDYARHLALGGQSFFLFLRTARFKTFLRGRRSAKHSEELDLLQEVVQAVWDTDRPVFLVPLALFWRKGPRAESRFLNLHYGALTRPSDLAKVSSFLATYRDLSVKTGEAIDLQSFIAGHRSEGPGQVARKVRRSILIYLYREEKVVEGPTLRSPNRVRKDVLSTPRVRGAIARRAEEKGWHPERAQVEADKIFAEIAANMNSTFLAALNTIVSWIFRKMFASIDIDGLDKVAESVKRHPVVLVPSHRSYFDFLILSVLLYSNYMLPPHIAARENMAFGPFGYIFRRAGAFFLRRSFDDPLYKEVFQAYVGYLVREGFTQEFFIEGGRSRTGKTLAPRLGMLSWDVEAFIDSGQRDLLFMPVGITYERLVEESAMVDELAGGGKQEESVMRLMKARKYLQRRFGSAHVSFGDPISLADALGDQRRLFRTPGERLDADAELPEDVADQKRIFIEELGWEIVEQINWSVVVNATSVAATVFMGAPHRGLRRRELIERMQQIFDLLRLQEVQVTKAFEADEGSFSESIAFLLRSDLIQEREDHHGEILYFEESRRQALDLYRNTIAHYLAAPSFMAHRLLVGSSREQLRRDLESWQEVFYQEFFAPRGDALRTHCDLILDHFVKAAWVTGEGDRLVATAAGRGLLACLAEQIRSVVDVYVAAAEAVEEMEGELTRKEFYALLSTRFEAALLLGEAGRREAANDTSYSNVLDLMVREGVLERGVREPKAKKGRGKKAKSRRPESVYSRVEGGDALERLRERLAVADADHA